MWPPPKPLHFNSTANRSEIFNKIHHRYQRNSQKQIKLLKKPERRNLNTKKNTKVQHLSEKKILQKLPRIFSKGKYAL